MRINRNTSFPQPVLRFKDDYKLNNDFEVLFTRQLIAKKYVFNFEFNVGNKFILELLNTQKAYFLIEVDCGSTLYTEGFQRSITNSALEIEADNLRDKYTIQIFICASVNIDKYSSSDFNDDYNAIPISVEAGDVLGYWGVIALNADKDWDKNKNISEFIKIMKSPERKPHSPLINC